MSLNIFSIAKTLACSAVLMLSAMAVQAQKAPVLHNLSMDELTGVPGWAELGVEQQFTETAFWPWLKTEYLPNPDISFKLLRSDTDNIGFIHKRYRQFYRGIEVMHSLLILHMKEGYVESFNGFYYKNFGQDKAGISPQAARDKLLNSYGPVLFRWDDPQEEANLKLFTENPNATWYPAEVPLVFARNEKSQEALLCYVVNVGISKPRLNELVLLDARNGEPVARYPREISIDTDSAGKAKTYYEGVKNITADFIMKDSFRLRDNGRNMVTQKWQNQKDYFDKDNYWNNQKERIAGDVQWAGGLVMDLMKKFCKLSSYDGIGGTLKFLVSPGAGNAYWFTGSKVLCFLADSTATLGPCASADVVGHEAAHAFQTYMNYLEYTGEGCAMQESFADINGHLTEFMADSAKANWSVGEKVWWSTNGIRSMSNPWTFKDAKAYGGKYFPGECHSEAGIQNYWFYIMVHGDTATNEFGYYYKLSGLGHYKSSVIHYRGYQYYMIPYGKYKDVMKSSIKAAKDLFGGCSYEIDYTMKAWKAVNIEDTSLNTQDLSHGIKSTSAVCKGAPITVTMDTYGDLTRKVWWQVDYKDTFNSKSIQYTFPKTGLHNIYLITHACNKVFYDSMKFAVNKQPNPQFQSPFDSSCSGKNLVTFKNQTVNTDSTLPLLYEWTVNPETIRDTSTDLKTSFPDGQDYEIQLKAYYKGGCWAIEKKMVTIFQTPHPTFDVIKNVCQLRELRFRNNSDTLSMPVTFTWIFPDSTTWNGFLPTTKSLKNYGPANIILQGNYYGGTCIDTAIRKMTIMKNPIVDFDYSHNCRNSTMVLVADSGIYNTPRQWTQWHLGSANPYNRDTVKWLLDDSATRTIGYTGGDMNGCYTTVFKIITIHYAKADGAISDACFGNESKLTEHCTGDSGFGIIWDMGNGIKLTSNPTAYVYPQAGKYKTKLIAQSGTCTDTMELSNTVRALPAVNFAAPSVCADKSSSFTNLTPNKNILTHFWLFGDNDSSGQTDPVHQYNATKTTTYFVTLTSTDSWQCSNSITKTTTVNELPKCEFTATMHDGNPAAFDYKTTANNNGNFVWKFGDGDSSIQTEPLHVYQLPGNYTITLKIRSIAGCECSYSITANAGVNNISSSLPNNIAIYPNPTQGILYVKNLDIGHRNTGELNATFFNSTGQKIIGKLISLGEVTTFNLEDIASGFYVLELQWNGQKYYQKVMKN